MPESMPAAVTVEHAFAAPPAAVWVALSDPVTARDALPGCTSLEPADGGSFPSVSLSRLLAADGTGDGSRLASVGDAYDATVEREVRGVDVEVAVRVTVTERDYPEMAVDGTVDGDGVDAEVTATLTVEETAGGCRVTWHAGADVGGPLATYGRHPVEVAVASVANGFFDAVDARLAAAAGPEAERAVKDPDWRP